MSKTKKQLLQELLDLENSNIEEVEKPNETPEVIDETINDKDNLEQNENTETIQKSKKPRTKKQMEAFERAKAIRDANFEKRKEEKRLKEEEERKIIEEKLVKKAISVKKKQIKKQAVLDEISDDETPIQKVKEIVSQSKKNANKEQPIAQQPVPPKPDYPTLKFF
jgi:hypothetical protein